MLLLQNVRWAFVSIIRALEICEVMCLIYPNVCIVWVVWFMIYLGSVDIMTNVGRTVLPALAVCQDVVWKLRPSDTSMVVCEWPCTIDSGMYNHASLFLASSANSRSFSLVVDTRLCIFRWIISYWVPGPIANAHHGSPKQDSKAGQWEGWRVRNVDCSGLYFS